MVRGWLVVAVLFVLALGAPDARAASESCKHARASADSVFRWQVANRTDLAKAAACLEKKGRSPAQLQESAKRIRMVYDAFGAWIVMDKLSTDPNYEDAEKRNLVVPHSDLPDVVIEKKDGDWVWTQESLDRVDVYYRDVGALIKLASKLPQFFHDVTFFKIKLWQFLSLLLLVVLGLLVRKMIAAVVAPRLRALAEKLDNTWPEKAVDVVASPGATLVTAIILRLGYPQLLLPVDWSKALAGLVRVLITLSVVWATYRAVDVLSARLADRAEATESKLDDQLVPLLRKTLKVVVFVIGTLVVLQNLEFDVTTLFASVSIGGLALSFAAKDTLANLFGSISIFVDTPFQIGDWINVSGVDGTVEEVGFRSTRLRTFYNSVVVMPNAAIANAKIDNFGRREMRRCHVTLGLSYDTSPEQVQAFVEGVRAVIRANAFTRKDTYEVHMTGFGASSLDVMVYFFFQCETWSIELREKHNVFLRIMGLAKDLRISFAFPTQSLHIESVATAGHREVPEPPEVMRLRKVVNGYGPRGDVGEQKATTITKSAYVPTPGSAPPQGDE